MILADSSVWIRYLRLGFPAFADALQRDRIATHWAVIGELACGNLPTRQRFLMELGNLDRAKSATPRECLAFIEIHKLSGRGIGWSDVQLLVAARLSDFQLWTLDRRLMEAAAELGVAHVAP